MNAASNGGGATSVDQLAAGPDLPTGDDFFEMGGSIGAGGDAKATTTQEAVNPLKTAAAKQQNFFIQKVNRQARANRNDPKVFDQSLVDTGLAVINELQKTYQFAIVKTQARPFMRKAADL